MKKLIISLFMIFAVAGMSYASMGFDAGSIGQQNVIDMRLHDIEMRAKNRNAIIQKEKSEEQQQQKVMVPTSATTIQNIRFSGNVGIPAGDLARVSSSYLGKPATDTNISAIRKLISKYYQSNGYYSAVVVPEASSLTSGTLNFQIKEGTRNSITIDR